MRLPAQLALLVAASVLLFAAPAIAAPIAFAPCSATSPLQCGTLDVPLDRSSVVPGTVRLVAARKVAPSNPTNTAVVGLVGGPGGAALPIALEFAQQLAGVLTTRDLLVVDPRGVGASSPIRCTLSGADAAVGARCATQLGAARGLYTTTHNVDDLEALREASGYEKLILYGVSYGSKVALDYAARYPTRVAGLMLDSVVLPGGEDPLQRSSFTAMRRVLAELCAGTECKGVTTNVVGDLAGRIRSLASKPLRGYLTSSRGVRLSTQLDRRDIYNVVLSGDANPTLRAELPAALTSARKGDSAPLVRLWARSADLIGLQSDPDFNDAVFASTLCEEGIFPWDRTAGLAARSQQINAFAKTVGEAAFSPFDSTTALTTAMVRLCVGWPVASPPPVTATAFPDVPTLVINGQSDVRTPLEDALLVKALIPSAQVLSVPFTGHSALSSDFGNEGCAIRAVGQFFAAQAVTPCAPSDNPFSPVPVAPTRLAALKPIGRGGKVGRTVSAAVRTTQDVRRQIIGDALAAGRFPSRAGGLRGGRVVVRNRVITLFDVVYIPGVKVSGTVPVSGGRQRLRISGPTAARGTLTITQSSISGRLGGKRVNVNASAASAAGAGSAAREPSLDKLLRLARLRAVR